MAPATDSARPALTLDDRYLREEGQVYLSGMQALVRLPLDQSRRDRRAGLRIGTFISGYPGSPLGGYDLTLRQARHILAEHDIRHVPGANEELAATALSGTQMLDRYPHSRYDGVVGLWYGKGPGVDRSGDALKHGNFAGTSRHGAVVVLSGDDHEAKSSTMPYQDDYAFVGHGMPVLYPASTGEFLTLGLHAIALSRFSGCWVAMKLVGQLADGGQTVHVSADDPGIVVPELVIDGKPFRKSTDFTFFPGLNIETERQLYYERHRAVLAYARANSLNWAEFGAPGDRLGLVTAGKSYADLRQALMDLGLDEPALRALGVRLLRVGLIYPLDPEAIREFARDLREIVVVEEKRGFLEGQVKEALAGASQSLRVLGKADETGAPMFPIQGGMDSDLVAERLGPRLLRLAEGRSDLAARIRRRLDAIQAVRARPHETHPGRTPNYCSGCPHNVGTRLLPGEVAWGSPGCHSFASIIEQPERHIVSMTQLGGEGLPWIGLGPYTDRPHMVQNVGDGSLFHSSYLNIRFCVAAGANMTFKILYNGFVANTGAQEMVGGKPVPELTRMLELEGVRATVVLTKEPDVYRGAALAGNARVEAVERQDAVLRELAATPGVTVLIHDGLCANERRRRQKRKQLPTANRFVVINEEVCEGCGHCGALTNCMSLHRVETELGPKTRVHTSSCNQDLSCLGGDCPSFVTVETEAGTGYRRFSPPALAADAVPEPATRVELERPYHVYLPGVGGTGVITMNALLGWAALIDGLEVLSYDQTGAAQKWGPVLSSLILARRDQEVAANKVGLGRADLYLALDLLAAGTRVNLDRCDPARTVAVVNASVLPSGEMVRDVSFAPPVAAIRAQIDRYTQADRQRGRGRAGAGRRPLRRLHGHQHAGAGRRLPGRAPAADGRGGRASDRAERRCGRAEPAGLPLRAPLGGGSGAGAGAGRPAGALVRDGASRRARAARRPGRDRVRVAARPLRAPRRGRAADARPPRRGADRLSGRAVRRGVRGVRPRGGGAGDGDGARARRGDARRDPEPLQAHGVQGRVRGGAAPPEAGVPRGHAGALRRASPRRVASPPAASPRARPRAEAAARTLVPARAPGAAGAPAAPGDAVRPVRLRRHPPRGAPPRALVPRRRDGGPRRRRRRPRDRARARAPPRRHPRLRRHQAPLHRQSAGSGLNFGLQDSTRDSTNRST